MSIFSKTKVVLWPKAESLEIYLDKNENNTFSFETNLWVEQNDDSLHNLANFFRQNKISEIDVLLDDAYVITKTFIYDSIVTQLDPAEVITLAKDSVDFEISADAVTFDLEADDKRTLVRTRIFNQQKFKILTSNLQKLGLKVLEFETVSSSLAKLYSRFDNDQYFFFYPVNEHEYLALLSNKGNVYLTSYIKKTLPDLKKLLNYAQAFFNNKEPKQYLPGENYKEIDICQSFKKATNVPLPVLSFFVGSSTPSPVIIKPVQAVTDSTPTPKPMENNKKNLLPIIAVFVVTAVIASVIVWFILNQNNKGTEIVPGTSDTENVMPETPQITEAPTPTMVEVDKTIKIQVLNATDINGQAATLKAELVKLGFENVATGNGKEAATSNSIEVKSTLPSAYFTQNVPFFATASVTELAETSNYDVIFTIGTELKTSSVSATPTL